MKHYASSISLIAAMLGIVASLPAHGEGLSRAQVQQELRDLQRVGYDPSLNRIYYPCDIQTALTIVQQNKTSGKDEGESAYRKALIKCH